MDAPASFALLDFDPGNVEANGDDRLREAANHPAASTDARTDARGFLDCQATRR
jgi:hypothetical protein